MISRRALRLAVLTVAIFLTPAGGFAHSLLVRSQPGQRSTITRPPERVQMWFSERLEPAYSTASVWSEAGTQVDARDSAVDPNDPTLLSLSTPDLGPGRYTVRFRVLSVDGHIVAASFTFTVKAAER